MNTILRILLSTFATVIFIDGARAQSQAPPANPRVGPSTPEDAARKLVQAFISRDESLFHAVRPVSSCEGKLDPSLAYQRFLAHTPEPIDAIKHDQSGSLHPVRIARIVLVTNPKVNNLERQTWGTADRDKVDWDRVDWDAVSVPNGLNPLFWFGAIESKRFDVITILPNGVSARSRVETFHIGALPDSGGLLPTNKWCAYILPAYEPETTTK